MYCTHCKTDTHNTECCWKLKKIAREKELSEKKSPYSKQTFCKEVNAIARRAGKNGDIKLVKKAIKREQGKHGKKEKKHTKVARAKKAESSDSDSSDESINVMRMPNKKRYAQRTILFDARGNHVDIKDSDSDDDHKMPAKISRKKPKKSLIPWTQNPLRRLMKMRISKQAKRKKPSSSLLTKRRTVTLTLID
jgi:hypothetical protein